MRTKLWILVLLFLGLSEVVLAGPPASAPQPSTALTDSTSTTSSTVAASATAVKSAYDLANGKAAPNADTTGSAGSLKSPATTGLTTITGPGAGATRNLTIPDVDATLVYDGKTSIEVGHATDTSITRAAAGEIAVEGKKAITEFGDYTRTGTITGGTIAGGTFTGNRHSDDYGTTIPACIDPTCFEGQRFRLTTAVNGEYYECVYTASAWHCGPVETISIDFDPTWAYNQDTTNRVIPLIPLGGTTEPNGITLVYWRVRCNKDLTTELDFDLICDTTPDFASGTNATVMDVLDTTAGASTASSGFDSATCATGAEVYIHFGAASTDTEAFCNFTMRYAR